MSVNEIIKELLTESVNELFLWADSSDDSLKRSNSSKVLKESLVELLMNLNH